MTYKNRALQRETTKIRVRRYRDRQKALPFVIKLGLGGEANDEPEQLTRTVTIEGRIYAMPELDADGNPMPEYD